VADGFALGKPQEHLEFTLGELFMSGPVAAACQTVGQQFGHITQQVSSAGTIQGWGGWVQGGYEFTPHWGAWLFYGMDDPNDAKSPGLTGNFRSKNQDVAGMLRFRAGRYQLGAEYFRANTTWATSGKQHAGQVALSVMYTI